MVSFNKKLSRILEESGVLGEGQLEQGITICENESASLSSVVVKQGWLEERSLLGPSGAGSRSLTLAVLFSTTGIARALRPRSTRGYNPWLLRGRRRCHAPER